MSDKKCLDSKWIEKEFQNAQKEVENWSDAMRGLYQKNEGPEPIYGPEAMRKRVTA